MSDGIPITDPEELAWCAFARNHEEKWRAIPCAEQGLSIASFKAGAAWERAACAELRQAGCICHELIHGGQAVFRASGHYRSAVQEHDPRCPHALAAAIEARGRA